MNMKGRTIFWGVLLAFSGAFIALFTYTRFFEKPVMPAVTGPNDNMVSMPAGVLTNFPMQQNPVDFTFAAGQTVNAVVHVKTRSVVTSGGYSNPLWEYFYGSQQRDQSREVRGYGSGVIISADGYIITNNHVIESADEVEVTLNDRRSYLAEIVGRDPSTDIALLKVKEKVTDLPWIRYGNSDDLKLGEWVLAVGNPFNLTSTVTAGIVSARGRSLGLLDDRYRIESFIQTDAALNMGNSGGALVNTRAELVGITTAIISPSGAYAGNSFAVPVTIVRKVVDDLKEFGAVQRAIIGVNISDVTAEVAKEQKLPSASGVLITGITPGGAAEEAGLKENDVIVKVNSKIVASTGELQEEVGRFRPGDKVSLGVVRDGKERSYNVTLRNLQGGTGVVEASATGNNVFGATLEPLTAQEKRQLRIDSGVRVREIGEGRLADLGIRKGYIITSVNGRKVSTADDIRNATSGEKSLTSIEGYQSNGTYFSFQFRN
ncbi:MAG: Do family serine endopeptidase [Bacteroidetes bacterium]|nr:Do family serine endopeptidase [Bacteroidota bacterium]